MQRTVILVDKYIQQAITQHNDYLAHLLDSPLLIVELTELTLLSKEFQSLDVGATYTKLATAAVAAFVFASKQYAKIAKYTLSTIATLVDPASGYRKLFVTTMKCISLTLYAYKALSKFSSVTKLLNQKFTLLIESESLYKLVEHWQSTEEFFARSYYLEGFTTFWDQVDTRDKVKAFQLGVELTKAAGIATRSYVLATTFLNIYQKHLAPSLINIELNAHSKESIEVLKKELSTSPEDISQMICASSVKLEEELRKLFEKLVYHTDGNHDVILYEVLQDNEAQGVAGKQEEFERLLASAPESIALLSHLCIMSATALDFQLCIPIGGFKYVRSEWFRGSLHQVVNSGAAAFTLAQKNITKIEAHTKQIPGIVLEILRLLLQGNPKDIIEMLPIMLEDTSNKMDQCAAVSSEVEVVFEALVSLINELTQTCTATRSEQEARNASRAIDESVLAEVNFRELRNALLEGLKTLIQVRQQWTRITRVFTGFAQIIKIEMVEPFECYKLKVEKKAGKIVRGKKMSNYAEDTLREKAQDIAQKGFQVNMLSVMFLQVSEKHLKSPLLSLDQLLALTSNDQVQAERIRQEIAQKCNHAQHKIVEEAKQSREESYTKFRKALKAIREEAQQETSILKLFMQEFVRNY